LAINPDGVLAAMRKGQKHWKELCEVAFDLDGHSYYQFKDSGNIPLVRYKEVQAILINLENRLSSEELTTLIGIARNSIVQAIEGTGRKERGAGLQNALMVVPRNRTPPPVYWAAYRFDFGACLHGFDPRR